MTTHEKIEGWLAGRLPADWFEDVEVTIDREEITVRGRIPAPEVPEGADRTSAEAGRIKEFRERTREARIDIALELEHRSGRKVSWGVRCGERDELFTNVAVPAMTRLRQPERQVLDTLVAAGVARSRADALAWCVKLVAKNSDEWLGALRRAMQDVERVRKEGPEA